MHECGLSEQVGNSGLLVLQFLQRDVDAFLRENIDFQSFNPFVFATFARHGKAEHRVFGDAVLAVRWDAHGDPLAIGAQCPVAHVVDGCIGRRGR